MPDNSPKIKIAQVKANDGEIFMSGPTLAEREEKLREVV